LGNVFSKGKKKLDSEDCSSAHAGQRFQRATMIALQ